MQTVHPGDRIRVIETVYKNPDARTGILARPGQIATVKKWVNAGALTVELEDGTPVLLKSTECEPL